MDTRKSYHFFRGPNFQRQTAAFSLVELMVVLAIIGVLASLATFGLASLTKADQVETAGGLISSMLTQARSEAISRGRLVQLRIATSWGNDSSMNYRKLSIWVHPLPDDPVQPPANSTDQFVQISQWKVLPQGVIVECSADPTSTTPPYVFASSPGTYFLNANLGNTISSVPVSGGTTANFAWIQFGPTGAVSFPSQTGIADAYMLVTGGYIPSSGSTPVYSPANHPDWIEAQIACLTGRVAIVRP
jgi:prepilin-type N-terminal cleavage/methylation domain-containing protein